MAAAQGDDHQVRYCRTVDAYRIQSCARTVLPASPVGRQLGWVLARLGGEAASLTEAEVRQHVSAEFLTVVMSAQEVIGALQATSGGGGCSSAVSGHKSPTVVFEGGLSSDWYQLQNRLAGRPG